MPRIQIDLPEKFSFTAELPVRVSDLNYGGHVGNDRFLALMQEARVLYYRSMGFENEIKLDGDTGQIIADAAVVYLSEAFFGDVLIIQIASGEITRYGFDLFYKITNKVTQKGVANGKTGIVCFDYVRRKVAGVPARLAEKLKE